MASLTLFIILLSVFAIAIILPISILSYIERERYKETSYYLSTKIPYGKLKRDSGKYGEYLTYLALKNFEAADSNFIFNLYIPKPNGETTEIDLIMINSKGIFVFESKNYSGFIFGSENQVHWTQMLRAGSRTHKSRFFNPIMQNEAHIKHLKGLFEKNIPIRSVIVFSNKCVLKNISLTKNKAILLHLANLNSTLTNLCKQLPDALMPYEAEYLYDTLLAYSNNVSEETKARHIEAIKANKNHGYTPTGSLDHSYETAKLLNKIEYSINHPNSSLEYRTAKPKNICPKCQSTLIFKTVKEGKYAGTKFYACSGYPKCKYIKKL